jgi:hypothetical protein
MIHLFFDPLELFLENGSRTLIYIIILSQIVNPSAPRHKFRSLLGIDPERRFLSLPSKAGISAVERVNPGRSSGQFESPEENKEPGNKRRDTEGPFSQGRGGWRNFRTCLPQAGATLPGSLPGPEQQ